MNKKVKISSRPANINIVMYHLMKGVCSAYTPPVWLATPGPQLLRHVIAIPVDSKKSFP